jgi:mRNA-degrading endonuclease RelE of RelBE toxin-antitoxin system
VEPEKTTVWKDRDACRVVIGSDNAEYEGTIKALNEDGWAVVHLIGMGKDVRQMMSELKPSAGKDARAKQRVKANSDEEQPANGIDNAKEPIIKVPSWEVGAFCRGVYKEDGLEYEGVIKSIETSGDGQYTIVQFIGYGNEESIWVQDLLESGGEEARQKQTKEALGEEVLVNGHNDTNVPTDEIDAGPIKTNIDEAWQPGMFCRGVYKEDGLEYEGVIMSVESTDDGQYAVVEFVGYGNQETLWLQELLKSAGDMARQKQTKEALGEVVDANESETVVEEVKATPAVIKTLDESLASSGSSSTVTVIAKEPWQPGMFCLSIYKEDGEAYEGLVKSIEGSDADGGQYAVVQFIGYGNEDTVWLQDLRQSKGEAARREQTERATVEVVDDVDGPISTSVVTETIDQNGNITKESSTEADKKVESNKDNPKSFAKEWQPLQKWQIGDFSRVVCEFDEQEHEVEILKQHPSNPEIYRVQVLGYGHKEVKNRSLLKESLGETARKAQIEEVTQVTAKSDPTPAGIKNTTINPPTRNESVASVIKKLQDVNNNNQPIAVNGGAKEYSPTKEVPKQPMAKENINNNQTVSKVVDLPNASGDTMDWKKKFEMKSAQFDKVSKVNGYLMTTLNKMEMEMQGHVSVIQELKSSIKTCLSNCPTAQPGKGMVNGY